MKTPTIFFGASSYVLPLLEMLSGNYDLKLVVTTEKASGTVPTFCEEHHIAWITLGSFKEDIWDNQIVPDIQKLNIEFAILADFSLFVPQRVLDLFPKGIINIHPSLLPKYRGSTPGLSAILEGETTTGVSVMLLDKQLDHGPVLGQVTEPILSSDTSATLYPRLFEKGTQLLKEVLPEYINGTLMPKEQDHSKATYSLEHLTRDSGFIVEASAKTVSPDKMQRKIQAFYPWPGVWTMITINNKEIRMKLLPNHQVQIEGKKPMGYKDFMNGYTEGKEILQKLGLL